MHKVGVSKAGRCFPFGFDLDDDGRAASGVFPKEPLGQVPKTVGLVIEERFVVPYIRPADFDSDGRPQPTDNSFYSEGETTGVPPSAVGGMEDNSGIPERGLLHVC